jgi:hypothetical protein
MRDMVQTLRKVVLHVLALLAFVPLDARQNIRNAQLPSSCVFLREAAPT